MTHNKYQSRISLFISRVMCDCRAFYRLVKFSAWVTGAIVINTLSLYGADLSFTNFNNVEFRPGIGYDIFDGTGYFTEISFSLENSSKQKRDYMIIADEGAHATGDGDFNRKAADSTSRTLEYKIYTVQAESDSYLMKDLSANGVWEIGNVLTNEGNSDRIPKKTEQSFLLYLFVSPGQELVAGEYIDTVEFSVYSKKWDQDFKLGKKDKVEDTVSITFTFNVISSFEIDIQSDSVDLGTVEEGAENNFEVEIKANTNFQIKASSLNNGQLAHVEADKYPTTIPYVYKFESENWTSLTTALQPVYTSTDAFSIAGERFFNYVKIQEYAGTEISGEYQDTITLEVSEF